MAFLEPYISPQIEILSFTPGSSLCAGYDDGWLRGAVDEEGPSMGIELPDDVWGNGGDDGIELPDDNNI